MASINNELPNYRISEHSGLKIAKKAAVFAWGMSVWLKRKPIIYFSQINFSVDNNMQFGINIHEQNV